MSKQKHGWTKIPLAEVGEWIGGGTPSKANPRYWTDDGIPWVSPKDMKSDSISDAQDHITEEAVENSSTNLVDSGSVLVVARSGILQHTLPVAVTKRRVALNQDLKAVKPRDGVDPKYLRFALKAFEQSILHTCTKTGTTVQSLEMPIFLRYEVPVAPPAEQHRIVAEIEKQFTRLDAGVIALRRVQANLKRYRAAILKAACEGRLVPTEAELARKEGHTLETGEQLLQHILAERRNNWLGRGKYKEPGAPNTSKLPPLPTGWAWATLPQLGELNRGKSKHRPRDDARLYGGPYPFIQTGDVRKSGGTVRGYTQTYSEFGLKQSRLWPAGTLCITIAANIAETGILTFEACFPDSVVGFVHGGDQATTRYVEYFMRTAKEKLELYAPATAQKNINLDVLRNVAVPIPPIGEQKRIVAEVERRLSVLDEIGNAVNANLFKARNLRQAILADKFASDQVKVLPQGDSLKASSQLIRPTPEVAAIFETRGITMRSLAKHPPSLERLLELLDDYDGAASPEQLLVALQLTEDVEVFFDLLRTGQQRGVLGVPIGESGNIQRIYK